MFFSFVFLSLVSVLAHPHTRTLFIAFALIYCIMNSFFTDNGANDLLTADVQSQPAAPLSPSICDPPTLRDSESHHVFISYSSTDYNWTHSLINHLEACGLQVCYHDRDFTPGRTVLENMSDCIQESQKVLLVLSPEFVRSRWCLLEANMSMFRDCLERKPIVPVLLEPGVSVPLHLCHLTYLEASDPDFKNKLLSVLCTPNQQLQGSTVVPFQPPSIYNGKALQPLTAVNNETLYKFDSGQFSDMEVPDQLRLIIEDHEKYRQAVRLINSVSQNQVYTPWVRAVMLVAVMVFLGIITGLSSYSLANIIETSSKGMSVNLWAVFISGLICVSLGLFIQLGLWKRDERTYIVREMQKAIGQANVILHFLSRLLLRICFKELCSSSHQVTPAALLKDTFPSPGPALLVTWRAECVSVSMSPSS